jgi:periplasmic protein TonB
MRTSSGLISLGIHALVIGALLIFGGARFSEPQLEIRRNFDMISIAPLRWHPAGGGGQREPVPASKGRLPPVAHLRVFTPPTAHILHDSPKLPVAQAMLIDPQIDLPKVEVDRIGSPWGVEGLLSGGPGGPAGIGNGTCCGVGNMSGPGIGPRGSGDERARRVRPKLSRKPEVMFTLEPEYSDEARKARYQGVVVIVAEIGTDGRPHDLRVVRPLGLGLDEKAVEAVAKWRFRPAIADGAPVSWPATIEVTFRPSVTRIHVLRLSVTQNSERVTFDLSYEPPRS